MIETQYNVNEYGHYRIGDKVMHRKLLTKGILKEMTVVDNEVVYMWVLWDECPFLINMVWDEIVTLERR